MPLTRSNSCFHPCLFASAPCRLSPVAEVHLFVPPLCLQTHHSPTTPNHSPFNTLCNGVSCISPVFSRLCNFDGEGGSPPSKLHSFNGLERNGTMSAQHPNKPHKHRSRRRMTHPTRMRALCVPTTSGRHPEPGPSVRDLLSASDQDARSRCLGIASRPARDVIPRRVHRRGTCLHLHPSYPPGQIPPGRTRQLSHLQRPRRPRPVSFLLARPPVASARRARRRATTPHPCFPASRLPYFPTGVSSCDSVLASNHHPLATSHCLSYNVAARGPFSSSIRGPRRRNFQRRGQTSPCRKMAM